MKWVLSLCVAAAMLGAPAWGASDDAKLTAETARKVAETLAPSLVRVEYTLQFDKGQPPKGPGFTERCPSCGRYHVERGEEYVEEERPLEVAGYLLSPTLVLTDDQFLQPRFISRIEIVHGGRRVPARMTSHARDQFAMLLELDEPLHDAAPLDFDASREGPYLAATYSRLNGEWTVHVRPLSASSINAAGDFSFVPVFGRCLIVDRNGAAVGMSMTAELTPDDGWKGSPERWSWISADELASLRDRIESIADRSVLRAKLDFRSPRASAADQWRFRGSDDDATEQDVLALLVDEETVLVLAGLRPKVTARLERITVHPPEGEPVEATFAYSLQDYGAFVAMLNEPLEGAVTLASHGITSLRHRLLLSAEVLLQGEHRIAYLGHNRIPRFEVGWRRNVYPDVPGNIESTFLFDETGALVALPIARREKAGDDRSWRGMSATLTAAPQIAAVLADLTAHIDASNVPLSEEEENRLAWLGVEMQELDEELARLYKVTEQTQDGMIGGLVTHVYEGSPAEEAGIPLGAILLRIHVDRLPRPIDVDAEIDDSGMGFPWHRLDEVPEEYFDHIPKPWPSVESTFTRTLTDLGFGTAYKIELFHEGEITFADLDVVQAPQHFDAAPQLKNEATGLTLRPLTYEVRRHFKKADDAPGLVVSRIEPGSKASVGGVKPYEIITHVNDAPVRTNDDFENAIKGQRELRLSIERMNRTRTVKISVDVQPDPDEVAAEDGITTENIEITEME